MVSKYMRGLRATEEQINAKVDQLAVITNEEADEEEIREVDHIVDTSAFKMEVAIDRSRALAAYYACNAYVIRENKMVPGPIFANKPLK